jgi:hypothetical protein
MNEETMKEKKDTSALFIPAGLFIGLTVGFIIEDIVVGTVGGLAAGFLLFALSKNLRKA